MFSPQTAFTLLLPAFAVIVLGTIGSVPGAIVASLIIGFVRAVSEPVLSGIGNESALDRSNYFALGAVTPYAIIIAILMIMPSGIGKAYEDWNIERIRNRAASRKVPNNQTSAKWGVLFGCAEHGPARGAPGTHPRPGGHTPLSLIHISEPTRPY